MSTVPFVGTIIDGDLVEPAAGALRGVELRRGRSGAGGLRRAQS